MMHEQTPALVQEIADQLINGVSTIVLIPNAWEPSEVEYSLRRTVEELDSYSDVRRLVLTEWNGSSPVMFLSDAFSVSWKDPFTPRTTDNLVGAGGLPDIIVVSGFSETSEENRRRWLQCVMDCDAATTRTRERYPVFAVVASAEDPALEVVQVRPTLKLRFWYNLYTQTFLAAKYQRSLTGQKLGEVNWKAALISSLAGADQYLASALEGAVVRSNAEIIRCLKAAAEKRGVTAQWKDEGTIELLIGQRYHPLARLSPDHHVVRLWTSGLLDYSAEYGWEVPSCVLAALEKRILLEHRIWRGQLPVTMPVINQLRLLVIRYFEQTYGADWLFEAILDSASDENSAPRPLYGCWDAGLYDLKRILENQAPQSRRAAELLPIVRLAHSLRNKLAHYTAIEPQEYFELVERVQYLGQG
jgi:hypothetical protein